MHGVQGAHNIALQQCAFGENIDLKKLVNKNNVLVHPEARMKLPLTSKYEGVFTHGGAGSGRVAELPISSAPDMMCAGMS